MYLLNPDLKKQLGNPYNTQDLRTLDLSMSFRTWSAEAKVNCNGHHQKAKLSSDFCEDKK